MRSNGSGWWGAAIAAELRIARRPTSGFALTFACQALVSAASLVLNLVLVRVLAPDEYGLFVLGFATVLFVAGVQHGLLLVPLTVRAGRMRVGARHRFMAWNWAYQNGLLGGAVVLAGVLAAAALAASGAAHRVGFVAAVACGAIGWMLREFQRCDALLEGAARRLCRSDLLYVGVLGALLALLGAREAITAGSALLALGLAAALAALAVSPARIGSIARLRGARRAVAYWRALGTPSLVSSKISWAQSQSYVYFSSALAGLGGLAQISASRLLFSPLQTLVTAWGSYALPVLSRLAAADRMRELRRRLWVVTGLLAGLALAWLAGALLIGDWVARVVFADKYGDLHALFALWGLAFACSSARSVWFTGARAMGEFGALVRASTVGAFAVVASLLITIPWLGPAGAVVSLALSEVAVFLILVATARGDSRPHRVRRAPAVAVAAEARWE